MKCPECGEQLPVNGGPCPACGFQPTGGDQPPAPAGEETAPERAESAPEAGFTGGEGTSPAEAETPLTGGETGPELSENTEPEPSGDTEPELSENTEPEPSGDTEPEPELTDTPALEPELAEAVEEAVSEAPAARRPGSRLNSALLAFTALVTVVCVVLTIFMRPDATGDSLFTTIAEDRIVPLYSETDEELTLFLTDRAVDTGSYVPQLPFFSLDKSTGIVFTDEMALLMVDAAGITELEALVDDAQISAGGEGIAYLLPMDEDGTSSLYLYHSDTGASELAGTGVLFYTLSPDGKRVAYMTYEDGEDDTDVLQAYSYELGGQPASLGEDILPVTVSDDGETLYYMFYDRDIGEFAFKVRENGEDYVLADIYDNSVIYFTRDMGEVVFTADETLFLYTGGGEIRTLAEDTLLSIPSARGTAQKLVSTSFNAYMLGVESFTDLVFATYSGIYTADGTLLDEALASGSALTPDGSSLLYQTTEGALCLWDLDADTVQLVTEDASQVLYDSWFTQIHYTDTDGVLYYSEDGGQPVQVTEGVTAIAYVEETNQAYCVDSSGALIICQGSSVTPADDGLTYALFYAHGDDGIYLFATTGEYDENYYPYLDVYFSENGGEPQLMTQSVSYLSVYYALIFGIN